MRFLIIAGAEPVETELLLALSRRADRIVCADAGAEVARRHDLMPDAIVGDFDSVSEGTLTFFKKNELMEIVEAYDQDTTDLEKAIILALDRGASEITITCATGDRNDHYLHNFGLLVKYHGRAAISIIDNDDVITLKTESFEEKCAPGEGVSLIPWGGKVGKVVTTGLKYPLYNEDLATGGRESVSNETLGDVFTVDFDSGMLLLIRHHRKLEVKDERQIIFDF